MKKSARKKKILAPQIEQFEALESTQAIQTSSEAKITSKHAAKFYNKTSFKLIGFFLVFIVIGILVYLQVSNLEDAPASGAQNEQEQVKMLVEDLGKIMLIPEDEVPQIATVADITKLTEQPFFKNAQNGDKVVIFRSRSEAILYRPSAKKIITMTPMNDQLTGTSSAQNTTPVPSVSATPAVMQKPKVAVMNSTQTAGLARRGGALLDNSKYDVTTGNAREAYNKTTISVVNKDVKSMEAYVKDLTTVYSAVKPTVVTLPQGEAAPTGSDIVVILGTDFADLP